MIADILHSFYTMPAVVFVGGVPRQVTVRWYKAPAGAKFLPSGSCIFSHVWDNNPGESIPGEVGEVGSPRTWDKGDNRGGYQGQCFRGDPAWFKTGQLPPLNQLPPPSPCLCQVGPAVATGGLVLGGSAKAQVGTLACPNCPSGAPLQYYVSMGGGTGVFSAFNGRQGLPGPAPPTFPCQWAFTVGFTSWTFRFGASHGWQLSLNYNDGGGHIASAQYYGAAFDCWNGGLFPLQSYTTNAGGVPPPSALVTAS